MSTSHPALSDSDRAQIGEILSRRANEIAMHSSDVRDKVPASVEFALEREIKRLRRLAGKVNPPKPPTEDEE